MGEVVPIPKLPELSILNLSLFAVEIVRKFDAAFPVMYWSESLPRYSVGAAAPSRISPFTSSSCPGLVVPIPTLPIK